MEVRAKWKGGKNCTNHSHKSWKNNFFINESKIEELDAEASKELKVARIIFNLEYISWKLQSLGEYLNQVSVKSPI